jgi:hypothetical protein
LGILILSARPKLIAHKATGGRVPCQHLATKAPRCKSKFLKKFGMPTLLWRVLHSAGYPAGKVPCYYWSKDQLGDQTLVYVEVVIAPRGDDPN